MAYVNSAQMAVIQPLLDALWLQVANMFLIMVVARG